MHFIGPLSRPKTFEERAIEAAKERAKADDCTLVAGSQVVPCKEAKAKRTRIQHLRHSSPAVVAPSAAGYLADCVVYELNETGEPIGIVNLPRMVNGWQRQVDQKSLVWACSQGAFVKLMPSAGRSSFGGMLGGDDMIGRVVWYNQPEVPARPESWLTAGKAGDPVAFSSTHAFRPAGGGYILKQSDSVYRFPLLALDLQSPRTEPLLLEVPFDGKITVPKSNFSESNGQIDVMGPLGLGVTWLDVLDGVLQIVLGRESGAMAVEFRLADIQGTK